MHLMCSACILLLVVCPHVQQGTLYMVHLFAGAKRCVSQQLCPRLAWRKYTKGQASKAKKGVSNNPTCSFGSGTSHSGFTRFNPVNYRLNSEGARLSR